MDIYVFSTRSLKIISNPFVLIVDELLANVSNASWLAAIPTSR